MEGTGGRRNYIAIAIAITVHSAFASHHAGSKWGGCGLTGGRGDGVGKGSRGLMYIAMDAAQPCF